MKRTEHLEINTQNHVSNVYIGPKIFKCIPKYVRKSFLGSKVLIVTDRNVDSFYGEQILQNMKEEGILATKLILPPGEKSKSVSGLLSVYDELGKNGFLRNDLIMALGGGVIGDLAGFAAATWQRGMGLVQVPTTLLAQIDSSIGGKTAIDLKWGKNMVGAFKQPDLVCIDPELLLTLDCPNFSSGMAEMIKYACIWDHEMFEILKTRSDCITEYLTDLIFKSCSVKKQVVEEDTEDNGKRMILNFGHTIAHVLESLAGYENLSHGFAVAIGMVEIMRRAEVNGLVRSGIAEELAYVCNLYDLPTEMPQINRQSAAEFVLRDKKARKGKINLVLLNEIGSCFIYKTEIDKVVKFLGWCD